MKRLIDANLLKKNCGCTGQFEDNFKGVDLIELAKVIDNQPTVYETDLAEVIKYIELEKEGLLHIAPLKDGTPIFIIYEDYVGFGDIERSVEKTSYLHGVTEYEIGELNKDYWLTYEAAEKALKGER